MPRKPSGTSWKNSDGTTTVRISFGPPGRKEKTTFRINAALSEREVETRKTLIAEQAIVIAHVDPVAAKAALQRLADAPVDNVRIKVCLEGIASLKTGRLPGLTPTVPTVDDLIEWWVGQGKPVDTQEGRVFKRLAELYPKYLHDRTTTRETYLNLKRNVSPYIGRKPVDLVTLEDGDSIVAELSDRMGDSTMDVALDLLKQLFNLAVMPCRLIKASPFPPKWAPHTGQSREKWYLFAEEEAQLMGCTEIPFCYRILYGYMVRNGHRPGEAYNLRIRDVDLMSSTIFLKDHKTAVGKHQMPPRVWALDDGTVRALKWWRETYRRDARPDDYVFVDECGRPFKHNSRVNKPASRARHMFTGKSLRPVELFRQHLRMIGLDKTRPAMFEDTKDRMAIRLHHLRSTFITLALATNPSGGDAREWVKRRTGHCSDRELAGYIVAARTAEELRVTWLRPLDEVLPELRSPAAPPTSEPSGPTRPTGQRLDSGTSNRLKTFKSHELKHNVVADDKPAGIAENTAIPGGVSDAVLVVPEPAVSSLSKDDRLLALVMEACTDAAIASAKRREYENGRAFIELIEAIRSKGLPPKTERSIARWFERALNRTEAAE